SMTSSDQHGRLGSAPAALALRLLAGEGLDELSAFAVPDGMDAVIAAAAMTPDIFLIRTAPGFHRLKLAREIAVAAVKNGDRVLILSSEQSVCASHGSCTECTAEVRLTHSWARIGGWFGRLFGSRPSAVWRHHIPTEKIQTAQIGDKVNGQFDRAMIADAHKWSEAKLLVAAEPAASR